MSPEVRTTMMHRDSASSAAPDPAGLPPASFVLVTCEHAGNEVPPAWRHIFADGGPDGLPSEATEARLAGHRGWDPGALGVAARLSQSVAAPLLAWPITRLLVDVNRSRDAPDVFSSFTRDRPEAERAELLATVHAPFRASVERMIAAAIRSGHRVLHVSVHSFVDVLDDVRRDLDLGVLFDPARMWERRQAEAWSARLAADGSSWVIRDNEPYAGVDDGLTTAMRRRFAAGAYAGIELELRQSLVRTSGQQRTVADQLAAALRPGLALSPTATFDR
jgi:predicted N-formylglutamate amidohydrolase